MRRDDGAQVAAVLDRGDRADIGDGSRKQSGLPGALVELQPVAAKLACVGLPPAAVRFGECAEPDIAQRGQTAPAPERTEERRVGEEGVRTCRLRGGPEQ